MDKSRANVVDAECTGKNNMKKIFLFVFIGILTFIPNDLFSAELAGTSLFSDGNLVAYYKLEDVSDSKGSYTLTNTGTVTFVAAKYNNGAKLEVSKYLATSTNLGIAGNGTMSGSFWIKIGTPPASGKTFVLFDHMSTTGADVYLRVVYRNNSGTKQLVFRFGDGTGQTYDVDLGTTSWHHIAFTRSVSTGKGYLDGTEVTSAAIGALGYGTNLIQMSESGGITDATIDDFGIFNDVLTPTEILTLYTDATPTTSTCHIRGHGICHGQ